MKSAYELALERLAQSDPETSAPLSDAQKVRLTEIDALYQGRIAEREIFLRQKLEAATAAGEAEAVEHLRRQLADERARLGEERDEAKERVRRGRD